VFNIILNTNIIYNISIWDHNFAITFGLLSFLSLMIKTMLTVSVAIILIATTSLDKIAYELVKIKVPKVFVTQLMLTYRYISVLVEETGNVVTAYVLRSRGSRKVIITHMGSIAGQLLLRSFDRSERIYSAMRCRRFDGNFYFGKTLVMIAGDYMYLILWTLSLIFMRIIF
jgi:cobalt/nickel transport system permease protein